MSSVQNKNKILFIGLIILAAAFLIYLSAKEVYILHQDSKQLPCEELPTVQQTNEGLAGHPNELRQIEKIFSGIEIDTIRCPGKAELIIHYETSWDRKKIKQIIGGAFSGIRYVMNNKQLFVILDSEDYNLVV